MSAVASQTMQTNPMGRFRGYLFLLLGLVVLYIPTYYRLVTEVWQKPESFHGALFFLLALWMVWSKKEIFLQPAQSRQPIIGWSFLLLGLSIFVIARSQHILLLEVLSQLPVFAGILLITKGRAALKLFWFPILFLLFLAPLPGSIIDALLMPLKQFVSAVVTEVLYLLGYPIARNGVVIIIGPYHLLIADACAGLNSIIALSGIGLAYVYLAGHTRRWHNWFLILSVLPIAIFANILRVACLTLVTYHFGDDMGQHFHDTAGMVEVIFALGAFFVLDSLLDWISRGKNTRQPIAPNTPRTTTKNIVAQAPKQSVVYLAGALMLLSTGVAVALTPKATHISVAPMSLENALPKEFGTWKEIPTVDTLASLTPNQGEKDTAQVYDQSIMRTYRNSDGAQVMLAVAWGRQQSQEVKVHRPELCYTAQGFKIGDKQKTTVRLDKRDVPVTRMVARNPRRVEPVTYWIRLGDRFSSGALETRLAILKQGLMGNVPDGILVRVSNVADGDNNLSANFKTQDAFLSDLLNSLDNNGKRLMVGNAAITSAGL